MLYQRSVAYTSIGSLEAASTYLHCCGLSLASTHKMIALVDNCIPQKLHVRVRNLHVRICLQDQLHEIPVPHMLQCAEPDLWYHKLQIAFGRGGRIMICFHDERARPCPVLARRNFTPTRSITTVVVVRLPSIIEQSTLDAKLIKTRGVSLPGNTRSVLKYDLSQCLRGAYLGLQPVGRYISLAVETPNKQVPISHKTFTRHR